MKSEAFAKILSTRYETDNKGPKYRGGFLGFGGGEGGGPNPFGWIQDYFKKGDEERAETRSGLADTQSQVTEQQSVLEKVVAALEQFDLGGKVTGLVEGATGMAAKAKEAALVEFEKNRQKLMATMLDKMGQIQANAATSAISPLQKILVLNQPVAFTTGYSPPLRIKNSRDVATNRPTYLVFYEFSFLKDNSEHPVAKCFTELGYNITSKRLDYVSEKIIQMFEGLLGATTTRSSTTSAGAAGSTPKTEEDKFKITGNLKTDPVTRRVHIRVDLKLEEDFHEELFQSKGSGNMSNYMNFWTNAMQRFIEEKALKYKEDGKVIYANDVNGTVEDDNGHSIERFERWLAVVTSNEIGEDTAEATVGEGGSLKVPLMPQMPQMLQGPEPPQP